MEKINRIRVDYEDKYNEDLREGLTEELDDEIQVSEGHYESVDLQSIIEEEEKDINYKIVSWEGIWVQ